MCTCLQGWINNYRKQSKRFFIDLKDGSTNEHLQVLLDRDLCKQNLGFGDAVTVTGEIGTAPRGHIELRANKFELNGILPNAYGASYTNTK